MRISTLALLVFVFACGQGPTSGGVSVPLWEAKTKATTIQEAASVAVDAMGDVVVAGLFLDSMNLGGQELTSAGGFDIFLAKWDPSGRLLLGPALRWSQR